MATNRSKWAPAWVPKAVDDDSALSREEAGRRVAKEVEEAKIALEEAKREIKEQFVADVLPAEKSEGN